LITRFNHDLIPQGLKQKTAAKAAVFFILDAERYTQ